jgi:PEP-CTERM motif
MKYSLFHQMCSGSYVAVLLAAMGMATSVAANAACIEPDSGGTAGLPPVGCTYTTPDVPIPNNDLFISNGLPLGTTVQMDSALHSFSGIITAPGGTLGGEQQTYQASLDMPMVGIGALAGYTRNIVMPLSTVQTDSAPRTPGTTPQSFATEVFTLQGQLPPGDPDFDLLRITGGSGFGLPSPGHTTLTRLGPAGSNWNVDSFFDITYRIDFVGHPGGPFGGMSGSTTGTARFVIGAVPEPGSCLLLMSGLVGIALTARRHIRA